MKRYLLKKADHAIQVGKPQNHTVKVKTIKVLRGNLIIGVNDALLINRSPPSLKDQRDLEY